MTSNVIFSAKTADKDNKILKIIEQIQPSGFTIMSDKINLQPSADTPCYSNNISSVGSAYSLSSRQYSTRVIYIPEYNDLMVVPLYQHKPTTAVNYSGLGSKFFVFHDFINPQTQQPHINVSNSSVLSVQVIPKLNNLTSTTAERTRCPQLIFWQHGFLWQLYPDIAVVPSGSAFTGKLNRYSYDGITLTLQQTLNVGLGSRYNAYSLSQALPISFILLKNGFIWCGGFSGSVGGTGDNKPHGWTTSTLLHIKENVSNDTWGVDVLHIDFSNINSSKNYCCSELDCFYFSQIKKWVYCIYGYSSSNSTSAYNNAHLNMYFNLSVDESNLSALETSLNTSANWNQVAPPYILTDIANTGLITRAIETVENHENKTVVMVETNNINGKLFTADSVEQLQGTKQWNLVTGLANKSGAVFKIGRRAVCFAYNSGVNMNPTSNGVATQGQYSSKESTKKYILSWTEDGENFFSKAVPNGLDGHLTHFNSGYTDEYAPAENNFLVLDKYVVCWMETLGNISSSTNPYGWLAVIDLSKRI